MSKERKSGGAAGTISADFGLGGMFDGIQNIIQMAAKAAESGQGTIKTAEFTMPGLGKNAKAVFGFSIKTMGADQNEVKVEPFGNIRETQAGPVVEEVREPIVDVFDEGDYIRVLAEMPGVAKADIRYEIKGDVLILDAEDDRKYHKEVLLPAAVKEGETKLSYRNGILQLRLTKA